MSSAGSGEISAQQPDSSKCATYLFPNSQPRAPGPASILKGHARSASHGGVGASPGSAPRPAAPLPSGHQRALSQGQIADSGALRGHSRVGSRTDFILPPGHKEPEEGAAAGAKPGARGHSRQASRSESIYTLRPAGGPTLWRQLRALLLRRAPPAVEEPHFQTVVPNHLVPPRTPAKAHPNGRRPDNRIRTTKYTLLSFLPKNLLEQFHRVANLYFIAIVLLNWVPAINAFGKEVAMIPVLFVMGVTAIKDLFEDRRRHASDKRINNSTCRIYSSVTERYQKVFWKDVKVGDLIHLSNNEFIPADVLLLRSSDPHGLCYIDTCNLDGESNLKQRQQDVFEPSRFRSVVEVDLPTTKIYRFHGAIVHPDGARVALGTEHLLLRECVVKNTDFVEGIVVYAGHETKAMLNNGGPRYKRSHLERMMNLDVVWCVLILFVLCIIGAVGCKLWLSSYQDVPFVPYATDPVYEGMLIFWTFVIILQVMIPLSLYVTIEMAKLIQVYHIHNDVNLFDTDTNKRVECRALNIPEELGQVQYVFSDKTGTLTENKMIFRRCTVAGVDYNHPPPENLQKLSLRPGAAVPLLVNTRLQEELALLGETTGEKSARRELRFNCQPQRLQEFLLLLAVCNTVVTARHPHHDMMNASGVIESAPGVSNPSGARSSQARTPPRGIDKYSPLAESRSVTPSPPPPAPVESPPSAKGPRGAPRPRLLNVPSLLAGRWGQAGAPHAPRSATPSPCELAPIYEAESPDELALVDAAHSYHCRLVRRSAQSVSVCLPGEGLLEFEVLQVLPFDSARKCMSVVLRHPVSKDIVLYCKGADSAVLPQLAPTDDFVTQQTILRTQQHLNSYARQGLRVLVMAKRVLSAHEYAEWARRHQDVQACHDNKLRQLRESYARLENRLTLLGATGIEDRLQDGVPQTISALMSAGMVVWVLTGDKLETAVNVAYSARLITPHMELLKLSARSKDAAEAAIMFYLGDAQRDAMHPISVGRTATMPGLNQVGVFAHPGELRTHHSHASRTNKKRALVVDGKTLIYILDGRSNLRKPFLELTQCCSSVLCCRTTPLQKAYIVRIVKEELKMRTLAIGDGANDVSMIQTADVGVGISGQEGMQAVMASDYALARFKHLERLLLVHGHWCYDRLSRMVLYFFYKNATFVFLVFWYQLYCGFSGTVMIDQMYLMLYNLLFTSLPPIAIGVYDQDVPQEILLARPGLYRQGRLSLVYKPHSFWITVADALYQSIVIFFISEAAYHETDVGIWEFGTTVTTSCMFVMLFHVAVETRSWTLIHVVSILASITAFYIFSIVYNTVCLQCLGLPSNYQVIQQTMGSPTYWLVVGLSVVLALLPRFVWRCLETCLFPRDVTRAVLDYRQAARRGEDFLVSWSRSTSTSSIFRAAENGPKDGNHASLTVVG
ncbi:phospholipid-transporting ATPase VD isoform X2 [Bacillus rossius redtenbacheri]|uniref:phospholipid-transporting ATPase VD isoform X2 n=1 Tax=Bacillus rossius redtenbacheri TaxID=93214 RepID=UPI002FDDD08D